MAIINHSGNLTADDTWLAADEHRITSICYIGNPGNPRVTITVQAGATIYFWGGWWIEGRNDNTAFGHFNATGTNWTTGKITILKGNDAEPDWEAYQGFYNRYDCNITMRFCHVKHANNIPYVRHDQAGGNAGDVDVQQCFFEFCQYCPNIEWVNGSTTTCNFIFKKNAARHIYYPHGDDFGLGEIVNVTGTWEFEQCYFWDLSYGFMYIQSTPFADDWPFAEYLNCVVRFVNSIGYGFYLLAAAAKTVPDLKNCYLQCTGTNALVQVNPNDDTMLMEGCVLFQGSKYGWYNIHGVYHGDGIVRNCDLINLGDYACYFLNGAGEGNIDGSYFYGNRGYDCVEPGSASDERQYYNMEGAINLAATPNRPLEIDTIVEGAPGANSITITFNSKVGANGLRCPGVGFIMYGTTSGGPYTEVTRSPKDIEELALAWCEIDGTFKETGHSVTINNLKEKTTYYYKCCFIDPLERIAESAEGSFLTGGRKGDVDIERRM